MTPRKKIQYCDYHKDVAATGACFECAKPICYNCTIELFGQKFCSHRCASLYLGENLLKAAAMLLGGLLHGVGRLFRSVTSASPRATVSWVLGLGLGISLFFIWRLDGQVKTLRTAPRAIEAEAKARSADIAPPRIKAPIGGTVTSNRIAVIGEAEENRIVSLTVNGVLKEAILPTDGKFEFKDIHLHRGENKMEVRALSPDGLVSTLEKMTITYADPAVSYLARNVVRGTRSRAELALTFDGGAENNAAPAILDALTAKGVKATFFLTGAFISRFPGTVRRIANEGHEVGNHSWTHPHLTSYAQNRKQETLPEMTAERLTEELKKTAELFQKVTGKPMAKFWRAPFGEYNTEILRWAAESGYRHIAWTRGRGWAHNGDTMDWVTDTSSTIYHTADEIVEKVIQFGDDSETGANGAVLLMHLGTNRHTDQVHLRLEEMIDGLTGRGMSPVTVSELLR